MRFRVIDEPLPDPRGGPQASGIKYPALVAAIRDMLFDPDKDEVCFEFSTDREARLAYYSLRNYVKAFEESLLVAKRQASPTKVWVVKDGQG